MVSKESVELRTKKAEQQQQLQAESGSDRAPDESVAKNSEEMDVTAETSNEEKKETDDNNEQQNTENNENVATVTDEQEPSSVSPAPEMAVASTSAIVEVKPQTENDDETVGSESSNKDEIEEYYVKYRNFSYLHCEWKTEEELFKGDKRITAKLKRFKQKMAHNTNIFENVNILLLYYY